MKGASTTLGKWLIERRPGKIKWKVADEGINQGSFPVYLLLMYYLIAIFLHKFSEIFPLKVLKDIYPYIRNSIPVKIPEVILGERLKRFVFSEVKDLAKGRITQNYFAKRTNVTKKNSKKCAKKKIDHIEKKFLRNPF